MCNALTEKLWKSMQEHGILQQKQVFLKMIRVYIIIKTRKGATETVGGYALRNLEGRKTLHNIVHNIMEGILMNMNDFLSIVSFGLACFMVGAAYGKDHTNKKKPPLMRRLYVPFASCSSTNDFITEALTNISLQIPQSSSAYQNSIPESC